MAWAAHEPLLAGAIEIPGWVIAAVLAVFLIACLIALAFMVQVLRAGYRLVTGNGSTADQVWVALGVVVVLAAAVNPVRSEIQTRRSQADAMAFVEPVTTIDVEHIRTGHSWNVLSCAPWVMPVHYEEPISPTKLESVVDQWVRDDAEAYEQAGWTVTRYRPEIPGSSIGIAFRADLGDTAVVLSRDYGFWSSRVIDYMVMPSSCPEDAGKIMFRRVEVDEFPDR